MQSKAEFGAQQFAEGYSNGCADKAELVAALRQYMAAARGFSAAVRLDSGKAYPWPALDIATEEAAAVIARAGGR